MEGYLDDVELLLLSNVLYFPAVEGDEDWPVITDPKYIGAPVEEYINDTLVALNSATPEVINEHFTLTDTNEWELILSTLQTSDAYQELRNMQITAQHETDGHNQNEHEGVAVLFTNPKTNEAVFTFRGTTKHEWPHNFYGGGRTAEGDVLTAPQEDAMEWFSSYMKNNPGFEEEHFITVTGHSNGGNKAKVITLLDNDGNTRVNRCVAFDAQGFSDEFYSEKGGKIVDNQGLITNIGGDKDFVGIILNQPGESKYVHVNPFSIGDGSIAEYHCADGMLLYNPHTNSFYMEETEQDPSVRALDHFMNGYLRSMPESEKQQSLKMLGEIVGVLQEKKGMEGVFSILSEENNVERMGYLLAFCAKYKNENPEFADSIKTLLLEVVDDKTGLLAGLLLSLVGEEEVYDTAEDYLNFHLNNPIDLMRWLEEHDGFLENMGLTEDQIHTLMAIYLYAYIQYGEIDGIPDGEDWRLLSKISSIGVFSAFDLLPERLMSFGERFSSMATLLRTCAERTEQTSFQLRGELASIKAELSIIVSMIRNLALVTRDYGGMLNVIVKLYLQTESILSNKRK